MTVATKLTNEEFLALPDEPGKQELLDGELIVMPPAKESHNEIAIRLFDQLRSAFDTKRVKHESGYKLRSGRWLQPDVSVTWPDQPLSEWFEGSPMIAIEIVSPGNTFREIERKVLAYVEDGAAEVWIVHPEAESMTVYASEGERVVSVRYTDVYTCPKALIGEVQIEIRKILHD